RPEPVEHGEHQQQRHPEAQAPADQFLLHRQQRAWRSAPSICPLTLLGDADPVRLGPIPGRLLGPAQRLGNFLEALALGRQRAQFADLFRGPRLAVAGELLAHALAFFAGAFFRPPFFFAGPFAARASISATACSAVTSSGLRSLGNVALVAPSVTYGP